MKKIVLVFTLLLCFMVIPSYSKEDTSLSSSQRRKLSKELRPRYKNWFDLVTYIATIEEKDVFLQLKSDRDREIFIRTFWQHRDPTPGTPENEYKVEIKKRFDHANKRFKIGSGKPGWMTDMGRFYIILGKPNNVDRYDSKPGLYPAQVWYYHGDKSLGLPTYFNITFYRPQNTTEWKLYSPAADGPAALLIAQEPMDMDDQAVLYAKISKLAAGLAIPSITMVPNEYSPGMRPSLRSNIVLSNIYDSPKRKINATYASNFLKYKGYVDVDSSVNFISSTNMVSVTRYERFGFSFINISVKPQKISVGYSDEKDQYFFNFELTVSLKKGEDFVYQYTKNFDFYIDPNNVNSLKGNGVVIHDSFPVIPGQYQLMVFAKNSIGKEFTYFDKEVTVLPQGNRPLLSTPVVGYKTEAQDGNFFFPYKIGNQKIFVSTEKTFKLKESPILLIGAYNISDELKNEGTIDVRLNGLSERTKFEKSVTLNLKDYPSKKNINILHELSSEGLPADYYELKLTLKNKLDIVLDTKALDFTVSPFSTISYPKETFKRSRLDNPFYFYYILATQYDVVGNLESANKYYERCIENNPTFTEGYSRWLALLNKQKKYTQVLVEVENLNKKDEKYVFDYHLIKGTALYGMKDYEKAVDELIKANEKYDSDVRVLNLLGFSLLNLQEYDEALKAFSASLTINQSQPLIKRTIKQVNEKLKPKGK